MRLAFLSLSSQFSCRKVAAVPGSIVGCMTPSRLLSMKGANNSEVVLWRVVMRITEEGVLQSVRSLNLLLCSDRFRVIDFPPVVSLDRRPPTLSRSSSSLSWSDETFKSSSSSKPSVADVALGDGKPSMEKALALGVFGSRSSAGFPIITKSSGSVTTPAGRASLSSSSSHLTAPSRWLCRTTNQPPPSSASDACLITSPTGFTLSSATWTVTTLSSFSASSGQSTLATRYTSASTLSAAKMTCADSVFFCIHAGP
mmetsp:Transcript_48079/g.124083  ORF Transcript_48079/g.124083 Transcript_48079/m.124083 type:complete len:256 (-) Transcript_48079:261-1028(-)